MKLNQKGMSLLLILMIIATVSLLAQMNLVLKSLNLQADWKNSTTFTNKNSLVFALAEQLSSEIPLQFSRYSINANLENCLKGINTPCDERTSYDMVLFAPVEQQSFQGGLWPDAPPGVLLLAGGKTISPVLYRFSGARCPYPTQAEANDFCPLQAIIQFKPLCGGTNDIPNLSVPGGGVCTGPATGFDITVGVARFMNGRLVYHENIKPGGDAQVFRFSSNALRR